MGQAAWNKHDDEYCTIINSLQMRRESYSPGDAVRHIRALLVGIILWDKIWQIYWYMGSGDDRNFHFCGLQAGVWGTELPSGVQVA